MIPSEYIIKMCEKAMIMTRKTEIECMFASILQYLDEQASQSTTEEK